MHNHNGEEGNMHHHHLRTNSLHRTPLHHRDNSRGRDAPNVPVGVLPPIGLPSGPSMMMPSANSASHGSMTQLIDPNLSVAPPPLPHGQTGKSNGLVKFNRNVEKDIFGYFCLSFLNEDGDISEKKVRNDFGKFGEVVSVRGALGKQKGHVFVRFRKKEAAENCLNCLNSFPLSEMSELFGKYLFLSPATPRDIDCDMYGLYSISFLNLNAKPFREISQEFSKFGEIVRLTSGGSINTDELVSISYADKNAAIKALQVNLKKNF
jgi:RNA recognition motif-containing protein